MKKPSRLPRVLVVYPVIFLATIVAQASFPPGPILRPAGLQWYVRGAHNNALNEYFVVWSDPGAGSLIRGFRVMANGVRHLTDPAVRTIAPSPSLTPDIAYNSNANEYLVVYSDGAIKGTFLTGTGNVIGSFSIFHGSNTLIRSRVVYNPIDDLYMVVWHRMGALGGRVFMQMVSGNSAVPTLIGPTVTLDGTTRPLHPHSPQVAWNAFTDKFFVAWTGVQAAARGDDDYVRGQIFNGDGTAATGVFTVANVTTKNDKVPSVAANSKNGEFLITFDRGAGKRLDVFGVIYNSSGTRLTAHFPISTTFDRPDWRNHAAYNAAADTYLVTYTRGRGCGGPCDDVLGNTIAPDGTVGPVIGIANDNFLQTHGSDDGFGSWGDLVSSSSQPDFLELYQVGNDDINAGIVSFTFKPEPGPISFDGDARADVAIWQPSNGNWWVLSSTGGTINVVLGSPGDIPVPGDYDGDGIADAAVYRPGNPSTWLILQSSDSTLRTVDWGDADSFPVPGDYDGDGEADVAVYKPGTPSTWSILQSTTATLRTQVWGSNAALPVPADYDGDGKTDIAVYRPGTPSTWSILRSTTLTLRAEFWGWAIDLPVPADYDGDDKADVAVYRPGTPSTWFIQQSTTFTMRIASWGWTGSLPVSSRMWWRPMVP